MQYSLLKFHPQKCNVLRLLFKKSMQTTYNSIGNIRIFEATTTYDLGMTFNEHLSFERHNNEKTNNANSLASMIQRSFVYLEKENVNHYLRQL